VKDLRVAGQGVYELDVLLAAGLVKALDITYIGLGGVWNLQLLTP